MVWLGIDIGNDDGFVKGDPYYGSYYYYRLIQKLKHGERQIRYDALNEIIESRKGKGKLSPPVAPQDRGVKGDWR